MLWSYNGVAGSAGGKPADDRLIEFIDIDRPPTNHRLWIDIEGRWMIVDNYDISTGDYEFGESGQSDQMKEIYFVMTQGSTDQRRNATDVVNKIVVSSAKLSCRSDKQVNSFWQMAREADLESKTAALPAWIMEERDPTPEELFAEYEGMEIRDSDGLYGELYDGIIYVKNGQVLESGTGRVLVSTPTPEEAKRLTDAVFINQFGYAPGSSYAREMLKQEFGSKQASDDDWWALWDEMCKDHILDDFTYMHSQILNGGMLQFFDNYFRSQDIDGLRRHVYRTIGLVKAYSPTYASQFEQVMDEYLKVSDELWSPHQDDEEFRMFAQAWNAIDSKYYQFSDQMEREVGANWKRQKSAKRKVAFEDKLTIMTMEPEVTEIRSAIESSQWNFMKSKISPDGKWSAEIEGDDPTVGIFGAVAYVFPANEPDTDQWTTVVGFDYYSAEEQAADAEMEEQHSNQVEAQQTFGPKPEGFNAVKLAANPVKRTWGGDYLEYEAGGVIVDVRWWRFAVGQQPPLTESGRWGFYKGMGSVRGPDDPNEITWVHDTLAGALMSLPPGEDYVLA